MKRTDFVEDFYFDNLENIPMPIDYPLPDQQSLEVKIYSKGTIISQSPEERLSENTDLEHFVKFSNALKYRDDYTVETKKIGNWDGLRLIIEGRIPTSYYIKNGSCFIGLYAVY